MGNIRKNDATADVFIDIGDAARRQYIDTRSAFTAWETAAKSALEVRGGMYWKRQGDAEYLIRTSVSNTQKSLGRRSPETQAIYDAFTRRKPATEAALKSHKESLDLHKKLNRVHYVGRAPQIFVDVLSLLAKSGLAEHFLVVGTHAIYAYEAAAGVRIASEDALATKDVDLLWDTRKRMSFITQMQELNSSMIGLLQRIDTTFTIRDDQKYTAVNSKGFEIDIIRRDPDEGDPHPLQTTGNEGDFWASHAKRAGALLSGPRFSSIVVSASGGMARVNTISPMAFVNFKRWMSTQPDRESIKTLRDSQQAQIIEALVREYLPNEMPNSASAMGAWPL